MTEELRAEARESDFEYTIGYVKDGEFHSVVAISKYNPDSKKHYGISIKPKASVYAIVTQSTDELEAISDCYIMASELLWSEQNHWGIEDD